MKKRGVTFIETVIAITIFLIGIIPVAQLTLNSLRNLKRASEIEEGARVASTVINYIKSQGYSNLVNDSGALILQDDNSDSDNTITSKGYELVLSDDGSSYILDVEANNNNKSDFELDFFGESFSGNVDDALFIINSLGISSDTIKVIVNITTSNLEVVGEYYNPVTDVTTTDGIIIGDGGIIQDPIIFGNVIVTYKTLSDSNYEDKNYEQSFVITPLENFNN